jgi:putative zinc finger protein
VQGNGSDAPATSFACIDAETLAAWADGGLSKDEAALVEVHLADCERCTAMLATFARTVPELPAAESLWARWHLRWLVPIATAATVAALWVLVPRPESPQIAALKSERTIASQTPPAAEPAPAAAPSQASEQETRERAAAPVSADTRAPSEEFARTPEPKRLADARSETGARADESARGNADAKLSQPRSLNETVAVAPSAPAREADQVQTNLEKVEIQSATPVQAPPASQAAAAPSAPAPVAGFSAESAARRAVAPPAGGTTPLLEVVSPDPMTRWRVIGAGQVERTTTGGAQWQRAMLPEAATLTGGSSPSPTICWLVGRTGSIYVTTDGLRFIRVPFRERTDFISIQATDALRATVVTTDGRTMRTEDQGATWIRITP